MNKTEEHADNQYTVTIEVWPRYYRVTWKEDEEEYEEIKWDKNELGDIVSDRILELPEQPATPEKEEK